MKREIRGILIGILITLVLMNTGSAEGIKKTVEIIFNQVNLVVNGEKVEEDTILYNGRTYVPLRMVAEMLGARVTWDGSTSTTSITSEVGSLSNSSSSPDVNNTLVTEEDVIVEYSRQQPAPINTPQVMEFEDYNDGEFNTYKAEVTVLDVVRGSKAQKLADEDNLSKTTPKNEGHEFLFVKVKFKLLEAENDSEFEMYPGDFNLFSNDYVKYKTAISTMIVLDDTFNQISIFSGSTAEKWVCFEVKTDDSKPLFTFGSDTKIWFKAYK